MVARPRKESPVLARSFGVVVVAGVPAFATTSEWGRVIAMVSGPFVTTKVTVPRVTGPAVGASDGLATGVAAGLATGVAAGVAALGSGVGSAVEGVGCEVATELGVTTGGDAVGDAVGRLARWGCCRGLARAARRG